MVDQSDRGRVAFERQAWAAAFSELLAAEGDSQFDAADYERLAISAYLVGRIDNSAAAWERAHAARLREGDKIPAARCAFWLAFVLLNRGELARGGGWVHRGQRLLGSEFDCVELGYLGYADALRLAMEGDSKGAAGKFATAAETGERFGSMELVALARVGQGRCLIRNGKTADGVALLDEAMSVISAAEVSQTAIGDLYCTVIEGCQEVFDVRRAREWTEALTRWCESQSELVIYRGQCLVHRAELMLLGGLWSQAVSEVRRACDALSHPRAHPALGSAHYVRAELHRVRGEFAEAEAAYSRASDAGREPQPGLAQLRLAQGRLDDALVTIRQAVAAAGRDTISLARVLGPMVEISLAAGDVASARGAIDELSGIAATWHNPVIGAMAAHFLGTVLIAEGEANSALTILRQAWAGWTELGAPYEAARARVQLGLALRAVGNHQGARLELAAARSEFELLGASTDLPTVVQSVNPAIGVPGLTAREFEVLRLIATGITNRDIATRLVISDKTVATHVSSILRKLGLHSRSAATAYAHQRHLL